MEVHTLTFEGVSRFLSHGKASEAGTVAEAI